MAKIVQKIPKNLQFFLLLGGNIGPNFNQIGWQTSKKLHSINFHFVGALLPGPPYIVLFSSSVENKMLLLLSALSKTEAIIYTNTVPSFTKHINSSWGTHCARARSTSSVCVKIATTNKNWKPEKIVNNFYFPRGSIEKYFQVQFWID